jgi:uncharacterized membrane protein YGL010W/LEA14-like dessication related protein
MQQWLDEYGESHRHPTNKTIHWICVPAILFSVLGLLWLIPVPQFAATIGPWANWATLVLALAVIWYLVLSPPLATGMAVIALLMLLVIRQVELGLPFPPWRLFVGIFVVAWIGQFIGHEIEGRKPSFFKDVQFLLIGPAWLLAHLYKQAGVRRISGSLLLVVLAACTNITQRDPLNIDVAGIEQVPGEGMEMVLAVRIRVQNPNDTPVEYDGVALSLDINDRNLASGVSDEVGTVPRYGETVFTIPVTISAFDVARQIYGFMQGENPNEVKYSVQGKLEGGLFGTRRFSDEGMFMLTPPQQQR